MACMPLIRLWQQMMARAFESATTDVFASDRWLLLWQRANNNDASDGASNDYGSGHGSCEWRG